MDYNEYIEAGLRVFGLWEITPENQCGCGRIDCETIGKHPRVKNWQHTPEWSEEQLETLEQMEWFKTGFGVLCEGYLVIDIDERNGGVESFKRLCEEIPEIQQCSFIVQTGRGGNNKHFYFKMPEKMALKQHLDGYRGIDFKSSGYVVGAGSLHKAGGTYKAVVGSPHDIDDAPETLISTLKKPERHRAILDGVSVDISEEEIADMLSHINPDCGHEEWYRIGMAIHHATSGTGFHLWDEWSSKGSKYPTTEQLDYRWHTFGRSGNPVTLGTLTHYAEEAGWIAPVEFKSEINWADDETSDTIDTSSVDILRPPGFCGKICEYLNGRSRYPRENLAVAAALATISSVAGMRYIDPLDNITPNLFLFGVAGSATGKESILKNYQDLLRSAGISAAVHGGIKSEQEIYRNLTRHQAALYVLDELGEQLSKIQNARTKGTSAYLEGIIGAFMSIYSKANGYALITGDMKEEIRRQLGTEYSALEKRLSENEGSESDTIRLANIKRSLETLDAGLENPYLCLFGLTTGERFGGLMDYDMAVNGFLGRALIFIEREDNPKIKDRNKILPKGVPFNIQGTLQQLYSPGTTHEGRVERIGEQIEIPTKADAEEMLHKVMEDFWEMAERSKNNTGLTAIPRRAYEQVAKISMCLAIPEGLRTTEHVRWAYALVKRDIDDKMKLAYSNSAPEKCDALASLVMSCVTHEHGETIGRIRNKARAYKKPDVDEMIETLISKGHLRAEEINPTGAGRKSTKYFAISS